MERLLWGHIVPLSKSVPLKLAHRCLGLNDALVHLPTAQNLGLSSREARFGRLSWGVILPKPFISCFFNPLERLTVLRARSRRESDFPRVSVHYLEQSQACLPPNADEGETAPCPSCAADAVKHRRRVIAGFQSRTLYRPCSDTLGNQDASVFVQKAFRWNRNGSVVLPRH